MQALGIDKPGLQSQPGRLSKCLRVQVFAMERTTRRYFFKNSPYFPSVFKVYWLLQTHAVLIFSSYWSMPLLSLPSPKYSLDTPLSFIWPPFSFLLLCCCLSLSQYVFFNSVSSSHHPTAPYSHFPLLQPRLCFVALISTERGRSVCDEGWGTICFHNN